MTKQEIMKLAEFDEIKVASKISDYAYRAYSAEAEIIFELGARFEHCRLLPLIEALAESNEKLHDFVSMQRHYAAVPGNNFHKEFICDANAALAEHKERMEKLNG